MLTDVLIIAGAVVLAALAALAEPLWGVGIGEGNGIVAVALLGAAGFILRQKLDDWRTQRAIASAFAATIQTQYEFVRDSMNDNELARWSERNAAIRTGAERPSFGKRPDKPYGFLVLEFDKINRLRPQTVTLLADWYLRDQDLMLLWDSIGTKELAELGDERAAAHYENIGKYRNEYRDVGYTALRWLVYDFPDLQIDLDRFFRDGARCTALRPPHGWTGAIST
ncbi:hypothetical protein [Elioraea sp.]|uniref:hypothetical protein n=1 Tax=Elioraea sp. TaxID=2185103 RepID=UPI003F6FBEAC